MRKVLYAVFDRKKGVLKRSSKRGKVMNFFEAQPFSVRKHLVMAERGVDQSDNYWRRIHA
ncbi:MAG: hypothetical protein KA801_02490 [Syntrophorhabdaceae bacterium]|nr:hypothetical protein [Syntrophorhabdaceae bacterium]